MKFTLGLLIVFYTLISFAEDAAYYETHEVAEFTAGELSGKNLAKFISKVSSRGFNPLGYKRRAKRELFGSIDLEQDEKGYFVRDVYCNLKIRSHVGPDKIPNNNIMNAEHTWPQSKGSRREPFKGDVHHLFPTDSKANSTRSNYPFGEVEGESVRPKDCTASKVGRMIDPETGKATRQRAYQPPLEHRGNVARAMFYASVFYNYKITDLQEHYLKKWHFEDPVTEEDIERNDEIQMVQGNRNPFIDFPELVGRIKNF